MEKLYQDVLDRLAAISQKTVDFNANKKHLRIAVRTAKRSRTRFRGGKLKKAVVLATAAKTRAGWVVPQRAGDNKRLAKAAETFDELIGTLTKVEPIIGPATGFWSQEFMRWSAADRSAAIQSAATLGHTAFALDVDNLHRQDWVERYLNNHDMASIKPSFGRDLVSVCQEILDAGMQPILYLALWPEFRNLRPNSFLDQLKYQRQAVPFDDFRIWRNRARAGQLNLIETAFTSVTNIHGNEVWWVDGVEPYSPSMPPSPPPADGNTYQIDVRALVPSGVRCWQHANQPGVTNHASEVHIDPGDADSYAPRQRGGIFVPDGWGRIPGKRVRTEPGVHRAFAAMPKGAETIEEMALWNAQQWRMSAEAGCAAHLLLYTGDWPDAEPPTPASPIQSPLYYRFDIEPWFSISAAIVRESYL